MLECFEHFIDEQHLFIKEQQVLLAVSGGRDSVCMAHLMHAAGYRFAIAHCNFHLRPGDCDRDERFVSDLAARLAVPFHIADFDTRAEAAATGESIEEAARRLRYAFFAEVCSQYGYPCVATAHHADDSVETFFLNLFRGTGIEGLHGIRPQSSLYGMSIVRPLLCLSRDDINRYVEANGLTYVEDSTNAELEARRNRIRHQLMPLLRELYPSVDVTMQANIARLSDAGEVYHAYVDDLRARVIHKYVSKLPTLPVDIQAISLSDIKALTPRRTLLFELLRPYGFNAATVDDILAARGTGRLYYSPTHVAELHRGHLLIAEQTSSSPMIGEGDPRNEGGGVCRAWRPGDRFRPKGMRGTRLVSDFLKDLHLSRIERQYVMVSVDAEGVIRSVIGLRDAE